jgi:hypothetical protein
MGNWVFKCMLGFSTFYTNSFSESLERSSTELDQSFRRSHANFLQGLDSLHGAVDAALSNSEAQTASNLDRGLAKLNECGGDLTAMVDTLMSVCADLAEREIVDPDDPLIDREKLFALIDYDEFYQTLAAREAALPQRVFWGEVVSSVQSGGARGGLRLLEQQLRILQINLCVYIRQVQAMRQLPLQELAYSLHGTSLEVAALVMGFVQILTTCTYISTLCGHAMLLYEQELARTVEVAG